MGEGKKIKVRCTGSHQVALDEMHDFQGNLKTLTEDDARRLKNLITRKGFWYPFYLWKDKNGKNWINDGHQRHKVLPMLAKEGWTLPDKFPAIFIEADDEAEAAEAILYQSNRFGRIDEESLYDYIHSKGLADNWGDIMPDLSFAELDINEFDQGWMKDTDMSGGTGEDDFDVDKAVAEIEQLVTKPGDLWLLGKHRLLCGDATKKEDVEMLMDGEKADMVFTDPPYNVNYKSKSFGTKIENDNLKDFDKFIHLIYNNLYNGTKLDAYLYICHATMIAEFDDRIKDFDWEMNNKIIWVKDIPTYSMARYKWQYESIFFLIKGSPKWYGDRKQTNVWQIKAIQSDGSEDDSGKKWFDGGNKNLTLHPTQKPVELSKRAIINSSQSNDLILDLFLGSGSTLIACEQTGRVCYGMEIEPLYCDVTIRRWEEFAKQEAVREDGKKFKELVD